VLACYFSPDSPISESQEEILTIAARFSSIHYWARSLATKELEIDKMYDSIKQSILIADIMHEALEDLITARGQLELVGPRNDIDARTLASAKTYLKELINVARHLRWLFNARPSDVENYTSGTRRERFDEINIKELVDGISGKYARHLVLDKIALRNTCSAEFRLVGMRFSISRAIDNAIRNSMAHLRTKTHVRREIVIGHRAVATGVKVDLPMEHTEIFIQDNGPGVEPQYLHRLADPFFSLRGGMGLGLAIIQAACEAHGGRVDLSNEWGKGFRVTLCIPVLK